MVFLPVLPQGSGGCLRGFRLIFCIVVNAYFVWRRHSIQAMFMSNRQGSAVVQDAVFEK